MDFSEQTRIVVSPMVRRRRRAVLWFALGCLAGCGATGAAVLLLVPGLLETRESEPVGASPEPEAPVCPELAEVEAPWGAPGEEAGEEEEGLPVPSQLRKRTQFWRELWGEVEDRVYLFVDKRRPWVVYERSDCRPHFRPGLSAEQADRACDRQLYLVKKKLLRDLRRDRRRPRRETLDLFDRDRKLARTAHRNLLVIKGLKARLDLALERAQTFLGVAERVFSAAGLPSRLARVAIIESVCDSRVVSPAGAVGAYQFVADTARQYLTVEEMIDERLDPVRASWAAARYIESLHQSFDSWPLAMTAYNTGPTRLRRLLGSSGRRSFADLIDAPGKDGFGFDGQNYYAQLAAVAQLVEGKLPHDLPPPERVVRTSQPMTLKRLAQCLGTEAELLGKANPALSERIVAQGVKVPEGYILAVPATGVLQARVDGVEEGA